jgi:hypothetical protein
MVAAESSIVGKRNQTTTIEDELRIISVYSNDTSSVS